MAPKLNIILDIDETLIYFIKDKFRAYSWDKLKSATQMQYHFKTFEKTIKDSDGNVSVTKDILLFRPHLKEFFTFLIENCNICFWTWSEEDYAEWIIDEINKHILTGSHKINKSKVCILSGEDAARSADKWNNSKDLNWLWSGPGAERHKMFSTFHECNTILIDDLPNNSLNTSNALNSITIRPFALFGEVKDRTGKYTDVSKDTTLLHVLMLLKAAMPVAAHLYPITKYDDDKKERGRWTNIFTKRNIKDIGKNLVDADIASYTLDIKRKRIVHVGYEPNAQHGGRAWGLKSLPHRRMKHKASKVKRM